jgi:acetyl-CoA carboxylase biotin carboxyl carrier protein
MFKFEEICELIRLVGSTKVGRIEIEHGGTSIRIDGPHVTPVSVVSGGPPAISAQPVAAPGSEASSAPPSQDVAADAAADGHHDVLSPIVGTFYRAPNPDAEPYVKVGDHVSKGQVLCIVEAMKLMNEIESDADGVVVKAFVDNAQPVEYGAKLFAIKTA